MPSSPLIEDYLAELTDRLPAATAAELADGLLDTWQDQLAAGHGPQAAARLAIADFGTPAEVVDAFVAQAPGRRAAIALLCTGPLVGLCWGASLLAGHAWTWLPYPAGIVLGVLLPAAVALLIAAATSRHSYRRTRIGALGCLGVMLLDLGVLGTSVLFAPALVAPLALAVPVSLVRFSLTARAVPGILRR